MPDPVSWIAVEKGWAVHDSEGAHVATVDSTAGDRMADIFDGFGIKPHELERVKYAPAEIVVTIVEGEVHLSIPRSEVAQLEDMHESVEVRVLAEGVHLHWYNRLYNWVLRKDQ
jgi:hypothetical protein